MRIEIRKKIFISTTLILSSLFTKAQDAKNDNFHFPKDFGKTQIGLLIALA